MKYQKRFSRPTRAAAGSDPERRTPETDPQLQTLISLNSILSLRFSRIATLVCFTLLCFLFLSFGRIHMVVDEDKDEQRLHGAGDWLVRIRNRRGQSLFQKEKDNTSQERTRARTRFHGTV